jgi:predicted DNA-binding transcriptional regulator AlpA
MKAKALDTTTAPTAPDDVLIRRAEQARLAGDVSIDTIKRWEREGICPPPVRIGPRFSGQWRSVWLAWLNRRKAA